MCYCAMSSNKCGELTPLGVSAIMKQMFDDDCVKAATAFLTKEKE
jgi:hypothetical protein